MKSQNKSALFQCIIGLTIVFAITGCNDEKNTSTAPTILSVDVVTVKGIILPVTTELPGRISAYRTAEVRPQVGGILLHRYFSEGNDVKAGDSLYQIDPATYQAELEQSKADLAKSLAAAELARLTVKRYTPLKKNHYVSQQDYDSAVATASQADAQVQVSRAAVDTANIKLNYTKVISPISGRAGKSSVTEGALLTTNQQDAMVTVQQLDPIYVDVTQSSDSYLSLKRAISNGEMQSPQQNGEVSLLMDDGSQYSLKGRLEFSDITVDKDTGSITIRALFPNPKYELLPGMYTRAIINEGTLKSAILVPQEGVMRDPKGMATVMIVDGANKLEIRPVNASRAIGSQWLISAGLKEGDKVVVSNLQKIRPGMTVSATERPLHSQAK
ncbi:efflux RND transporter periplasmic adaptor subunit [Budviciaceae bacterium BWR-B9]|uniref:Efflux RND transporter periplasmic adaptor subunit n=1 Tax=Limnobaculum allomyrinae TaxID=2791986 RepID=A0ABS1IMZ3_9GAMM|nr:MULTISPECIES: efflux RND transporter periplasmic adaptor subunit [Limnobaculum]MBK5143122.1 efflux RND transporter periplasmic adaptor subunit [Limnobaculum allomyrinae]MBV7691011.1 efflux RND transporter periplasmic adaptor subunit [Limnobaculum sp. M2-1]